MQQENYNLLNAIGSEHIDDGVDFDGKFDEPRVLFETDVDDDVAVDVEHSFAHVNLKPRRNNEQRFTSGVKNARIN